jgi:hypothetical protein
MTPLWRPVLRAVQWELVVLQLLDISIFVDDRVVQTDDVRGNGHASCRCSAVFQVPSQQTTRLVMAASFRKNVILVAQIDTSTRCLTWKRQCQRE